MTLFSWWTVLPVLIVALYLLLVHVWFTSIKPARQSRISDRRKALEPEQDGGQR